MGQSKVARMTRFAPMFAALEDLGGDTGWSIIRERFESNLDVICQGETGGNGGLKTGTKSVTMEYNEYMMDDEMWLYNKVAQ